MHCSLREQRDGLLQGSAFPASGPPPRLLFSCDARCIMQCMTCTTLQRMSMLALHTTFSVSHDARMDVGFLIMVQRICQGNVKWGPAHHTQWHKCLQVAEEPANQRGPRHWAGHCSQRRSTWQPPLWGKAHGFAWDRQRDAAEEDTRCGSGT